MSPTVRCTLTVKAVSPREGSPLSGSIRRLLLPLMGVVAFTGCQACQSCDRSTRAGSREAPYVYSPLPNGAIQVTARRRTGPGRHLYTGRLETGTRPTHMRPLLTPRWVENLSFVTTGLGAFAISSSHLPWHCGQTRVH